jgi:hypothetical protein
MQEKAMKEEKRPVIPLIMQILESALESTGNGEVLTNEQSSQTLSSLSTSIGKHKSKGLRRK